MKILSWNILHGGGSRINAILGVIGDHAPDILCLQEFRVGKHTPLFIDQLATLGLTEQCVPETTSRSRNTVAVFSSQQFAGEVLVSGVQGSARVLSMAIRESPVPLNIVSVSFPHKKEQVPVFEKLLDLGSDYLDSDTLLIGDFNCGIPFEDSETRSFYATHLFQAMLKNGWMDSWRSRHPDAREFTWFSTQKGNGFRYDHALASATFDQRIQNIRYDHQPRELRISDHSPLLLEIA